jgi:O-antigen ligase
VLYALIVVPAVVALVVLTLVGRFDIAAALLLALLFARISDVGVAFHGWPSIAQPLTVLIAVAILLSRVRARSHAVLRCVSFWSAAAMYLAVVLGSAIWAHDSHAALHQATDLAKNLLIVYVLVEAFATRRSQRIAVWTLVVTAACLAALSVAQAVTSSYSNQLLGLAQAHIQQITGSQNGYRSAGPVGDANFYGLALASAVPLAVLRIRDEARAAVRLAALACLFVILAAIVYTYSRGALVALAVGAVLLVAMLRVPIAVVVIAGGLFVVSALVVLPSDYRDRAINIATSDHSLQGHAGSQEVALALFTDHPLLGVGADNYRSVYLPVALRVHLVDAASTVHNVYLAILSETGFVGLSAFLGALVVVLRRSARMRKQATRDRDRVTEGLAISTFVALVVYLAGSLFLPLAYPRYLWVLVGLALAVALPAREPVGRPSGAPKQVTSSP